MENQMDPDETIRTLRSLIKSRDPDDRVLMAYYCDDLAGWLSSGGFRPSEGAFA
jgi:hypothetical protein